MELRTNYIKNLWSEIAEKNETDMCYGQVSQHDLSFEVDITKL